MIQRIQSVYLTFMIVLSLLLLNGALQNFTGGSGTIVSLMTTGSLSGEEGDVHGKLLIVRLIPVLAVIIAFIALVTIFFFRNRRIQLLLSGILTGLSAVLTVLFGACVYYVVHTFDLKLVFGLKLMFALLVLIFSVLAYMGIRKDERLVRSYDRLR